MIFLYKKSVFYITHVLFILVLLFSFSNIPLYAATGNGDSLNTSINLNVSIDNQKRLIKNMNEEQLTELVDSLFSMDSLSKDLVNEIYSVLADLRQDKNKMPSSENISDPVFPSANYYESWEINNLFSEDAKLKMNTDTSFTLILQNTEHSNYFHPFNGPVTSNFGWRHKTQHKGIDIDLNKGDNVLAAFDGMVRVARKCGGFGNVVIIRHYNGLETVYAHLSKIKVQPGQLISAGDLVGLGGSTGHSTGSHLHFEIRFKGIPINPKYLISFSEQKLIDSEYIIKKTKWGLAAYPTNSKLYIVEKGDTVSEIAKHFGTTTTSIKKMNHFNTGRVLLKAGQLINVGQ